MGSGHTVCICDRDQVIAATTGAKSLFQKNISKALEQLILNRESRCAGKEDKTFVPVTADGEGDYTAQLIVPVVSEGDAIGAVVLLSREPRAKMGEIEQKLATTAAGFLGRQMES